MSENAPTTMSANAPPRRRASVGRLYKQRDPRHPGELLGTWWLDYSIRGKRYRESAKTTVRSEAVKLLRQRITEHGSGRYAPNAERVTLDQLMTGFRTDYALNDRRSLDRANSAFAHVVEHFGGETLALDLTPELLQTYAVERLLTAAKATVRYELACLKKAMTLAVKNGVLTTRPTFPQITATTIRQGFFEAPELEAVVAELPEGLRPVVRFAAITGWRKQECLDLTWSRVDSPTGVVRLDPGTTKNGKGRVYPFGKHAALMAVIEEQRAYTEAVQKRTGQIVPWVFHREGRPIKDMYTAWRAACDRAGCPGRILHDLRRTSVRALVRAGVSEKVCMELTGHKTRAVFDRYNIVNERDLGEAVTKLDAATEATPASRQVLPMKTARG
jgi:integrase